MYLGSKPVVGSSCSCWGSHLDKPAAAVSTLQRRSILRGYESCSTSSRHSTAIRSSCSHIAPRCGRFSPRWCRAVPASRGGEAGPAGVQLDRADEGEVYGEDEEEWESGDLLDDSEGEEEEEDEDFEQIAAGVMEQLRPTTVPTPQLAPEDVLQALYASVHEGAESYYKAFYSSELGGIVTDPALMFVHIDDHMVHRGHAVFDTCTLIEGQLYELGPHLERLMSSAERAGIDAPFTLPQMMRTIAETCAASNALTGFVRFWLSAGRGGFGLSPMECTRTGFYIMVTTGPTPVHDVTVGWKVKTTEVPIKHPYFATLKSTNYLQNALALADAQSEDYDQGIFVDAEGNVAEGPNLNLGIITWEDELVTPPFESALPGVTLQRLAQLVDPHLGEQYMGLYITDIQQRPIPLDEARKAKEVFLTSSSVLLMPVVSWDGQPIADGKPGVNSLALRAMLEQDVIPRAGSDQHLPVPYGFNTGMRMPGSSLEPDPPISTGT